MKENIKLVDLSSDWVEVKLPPDDSIIELDVGDEFIGIFVDTIPNYAFDDEVIHVFKDDMKNVRKMYGKTNLDRWMKAVQMGSRIRIKRLDDKKVGQPKPLHMFKVWVWSDK